MPFTISHPAIILPLCRNKRFSVTALFAGSMVPDFEFFFQLREVENIGHHWYGIVLFDLPVAFLLCYLFHGLLRNVLLAHLPATVKSRFIETGSFNWHAHVRNNPVAVFLSLAVGIASHIVWDGFTHYDGFVVENIVLLQQNTGWQWLNIPFYFLLQLLFSIAGLGVMFYAMYRLPKITVAPTASDKRIFWLSLSLLVSAFLLIRIIGWPQYNSFGGILIALMGCGFYAWVLVSVLFKFIFKHH